MKLNKEIKKILFGENKKPVNKIKPKTIKDKQPMGDFRLRYQNIDD